MFIAVGKYNKNVRNALLVFDTDDCTAEYVTFEQIKCNNIKIENVFERNGNLVPNMLAIHHYLWSTRIKTEFVRATSATTLYVGETMIVIRQHGKSNKNDIASWTNVNGKTLLLRGELSLLYMFLFEGYIILRMRARFDVNTWYTVAVGKNSIEQWSPDMRYCTNNRLAVRVDMMNKV